MIITETSILKHLTNITALGLEFVAKSMDITAKGTKPKIKMHAIKPRDSLNSDTTFLILNAIYTAVPAHIRTNKDCIILNKNKIQHISLIFTTSNINISNKIT